jgi:hypothetical protein
LSSCSRHWTAGRRTGSRPLTGFSTRPHAATANAVVSDTMSRVLDSVVLTPAAVMGDGRHHDGFRRRVARQSSRSRWPAVPFVVPLRVCERIVRDLNPSSQHQFGDVTQAHPEAVIEPHTITDDRRRFGDEQLWTDKLRLNEVLECLCRRHSNGRARQLLRPAARDRRQAFA